METFALMLILAVAGYTLKTRDEQRRIALLAGHLRPYRIEKHMEALADGYLRALGEDDPLRADPIWAHLEATEQALSEQFQKLASDIAGADPEPLQVSKLGWSLPFLIRVFPGASFDLRKLIAVHANGIANAVRNAAGRDRKEKAFLLCAEMYLMQHTCHWYCKSRTVASARILARHKTAYAQVLAAVSPQTRQAYLALTAG